MTPLDIYVTGHPRSGNTWLGRLLSDILKAEYITDTTLTSREASYWGEGKPTGEYLIYKTHSREKLPGPTVFVYRDPRDVICSIWHYRNKYNSIEEVINRLAEPVDDPGDDRYGQYESFIRLWWNTGRAQAQIRYEDLHIDPVHYLARAIFQLTHFRWSTQDIINGVFRQEFGRIKAAYQPTQDHAMWQGVTQNWRNYYTRRDADLTQAYFGNLMLEQGYIDSPDWVHEIKL